MTIEQLLGPLGLTIAALFAVGYLMRFLVRLIREYIDDIKAGRQEAMQGWRVQTDASAAMARAEEARTQELAARRRLGDEAT